MKPEDLYEIVGLADEKYILTAEKKVRTFPSYAYKCVASLLILFAFASIIYGIQVSGILQMGGTANGSMYIEGKTLYYGGKSGGIYEYTRENGSNLLVKKADSLFAVKDSDIYYTYKDSCYVLDLETREITETSDFPDEADILYSDANENSPQIQKILSANEEIAVDAPFALYDGSSLYVSHNAFGGYISVYQTRNNGNRIEADMESEVILENSYTVWQSLISGIGTIEPMSLFANLLYWFMIPAICIIIAVFIKKVVRNRVK